ncbi:hypothetical protein ACOME3_005294 [Neoechinorhynchus agilis]
MISSVSDTRRKDGVNLLTASTKMLIHCFSLPIIIIASIPLFGSVYGGGNANGTAATTYLRTEAGRSVEFACSNDVRSTRNTSLMFSDDEGSTWSPLNGFNITKGVVRIDGVDLKHSGLYKCLGGSEKLYHLWVYDLQLSWVYTCPSDGSAHCSPDYDKNRMYIVENATVVLGCTSFYANMGESVKLETRVPSHWESPLEKSNKSSVSQSKRWRVSISARDRKQKVQCAIRALNREGKYETLAETGFTIEVRDAKNPDSLLDDKRFSGLSLWFGSYYKYISLIFSILSIIAALTILVCWKRRRHRKIAMTPTNQRQRSNSILLSRSVRDKRLHSGPVIGYSIPAEHIAHTRASAEYFDRSRASLALINSKYPDSSDSENDTRTPPKRPPPRLK